MKLAIIGTGRIVHEALYAMEDILKQGTIELTSVYARPHSLDTAKELAAQYHIPQVYTDYDELLGKDSCEAVYIGLVNSAHFDYARKALEAGRHVILEKPLVSTIKEAEMLTALAHEKEKYVLEAITVLHNPAFLKMQSWLPALGQIRMIQANYSQYSARYDQYLQGEVMPAFDPQRSGGALYDINLYNLYWCVGLAGAPDRAQYFPNIGFNGIDTSGAAVLEYSTPPTSFKAVCSAAKDSDSQSFVMMQGEKGWMRLNGKPNSATDCELWCVEPSVKSEEKAQGISSAGSVDRSMRHETFAAPAVRHRMSQEFRDFAAIIDGHRSDAAEKYLQQSLAVIRLLETMRLNAGIHFAVDD